MNGVNHSILRAIKWSERLPLLDASFAVDKIAITPVTLRPNGLSFTNSCHSICSPADVSKAICAQPLRESSDHGPVRHRNFVSRATGESSSGFFRVHGVELTRPGLQTVRIEQPQFHRHEQPWENPTRSLFGRNPARFSIEKLKKKSAASLTTGPGSAAKFVPGIAAVISYGAFTRSSST